MKFALLLHILGVVVWVGGMFFAYMALRPAAIKALEPPLRLSLWRETFANFFRWVWAAIVFIFMSGLYMMEQMGRSSGIPIYVWLMFGVGIVMTVIFLHIYFAPYARLRRFVDAQSWQSAGEALAQIRLLVGINLSLGLVAILIGTVGAKI